MDSTISVFGNPAVWWVGFTLMIVLTERAIRGKELAIGLKNWLVKSGRNLILAIRRRLGGKDRASEPQNQVLPETSSPISETEPSAEAVPEVSVPAVSADSPTETPTPEVNPAPAPIAEPAAEPTQNSGRGWDIAALFIVVVFFFSWVPYIFISRVTFIYHFYVSVPFLILASTYFINKYWNTKWGKIATIIFFAAVIVMFAIFYPVISGMPVSTSWIYKLKWFPSWFFAP